MNLILYLKKILEEIEAYKCLPELGNLNEFAKLCYIRYIEWFGYPEDDDWKWEIIIAPQDSCRRITWQHKYYLSVRKDYKFHEQRCAAVAHEMYHRVSYLKKGLRRELWVDEMLAFLASQHILMDTSLEYYANQRLDYHSNASYIPTVMELKKVQSHVFKRGWHEPSYPEGFGAGLALLGNSLQSTIGWYNTCRLVDSLTWEEWLKSMPPTLQNQAISLLRLDMI